MNRKLHGQSCCCHCRIAVYMNDSTCVTTWYNAHKAPFRKCEERRRKSSALGTNTEVLKASMEVKWWISKGNFAWLRRNLNRKWIVGQHLHFLLGTSLPKPKILPSFVYTFCTLNRMKTCLEIINSVSAAFLH